jgi:glycine betaine catabolism B
MRATFIRLEWENKARTIASVYLEPDSRYRYEAGQYADIIIAHENPDDRGTGRVMTWSSSPDEKLLKFTFKYYSDKGSSYKRALVGMKPGDSVTIHESLGDLVLPMDPAIPLVWVAGGVGIASFIGMARFLTDHQEKRGITLHYAVSSEDDIIWQGLFNAYPLNMKLYVSSARRLKVQDILDDTLPETLVYISGTEKLVEAMRNGLEAAGIPRSRIVFDYYEGYSEPV